MPERRWRTEALKSLDGTLGRLACTALTLGRRPGRGGPVDPARVRRLLVIRPGGLGDAVHLVPLLDALRAHFDRAEIDLLLERRNAGLVERGRAARVFLYDRNVPRELGAVLRGGYDVVVDTEQWYRFSAVVAFLTRAPVRCGFATNRRGRLFTHPVAYDEAGYEARVFLSLYEALSGKRAGPIAAGTFLAPDDGDRAWAAATLGALAGRRLAVVAPGAAIAERQWDPLRWAEVARRLAADGWTIVLVGSSGDAAVCRTVVGALDGRPSLDLSGRATIGQTAAVIARASVYLSSDGGLLHVAHALGVPVVGLFGSGVWTKWGPPGPRARVVRHALSCSPCTRFGHTPPCPFGVECLRQVTAAEVAQAAGDVAPT
jgi:lipopolysaccharide heptosyltransferase II